MTFQSFGFVDPYLPKCSKCGLNKDCKTPKMRHSGEGKLKTLIIGERPGAEEDREGIQFVGEAGFAFEKLLKQYGLKLHYDFWLINATNCFVKGNPKPTRNELLYCWPLVQKAIDTLSPDNIWLMGGSVIEAFFMKRFSTDTSITRFRGFRIPDRDYNAWLFPMYHPSYVLIRNSHDRHLKTTYERDLKHAIDHINKGKPVFNDDYKDEAQIETESKDIINHLTEVKKKAKFFFFDFETSGLKPYNKGHKIYTISHAALDNKYNTISLASYPLQYPNHFKKQEVIDIRNAFATILKDKSIKKAAHNMAYEDVWAEFVLKAKVRNWFWCTMEIAHLIDERHKTSGLDFQSYVHLGIPDYSGWLSSYKKSKTANSFNNMHRVDLAKLLIYGGTDAWAMRELFFLQFDIYKQEEYLRRIWKDLFKNGTLCLTETTKDGIKGDRDYFEEKRLEVSKKASELKEKLNDSDIGKQFRKRQGTEPNLRSPDDLKIIVYDLLGCESEKVTKSGNKSVDQEVLESIEDSTGWVKELLEYKKLDKIVGTFIKNMQVELNDDGYIRPSYYLLNTSGRSSSSSPNVQQIPKRQEQAKKIIRRGLIVEEDEYPGEVDYGSMEWNIATCHTRDPEMVKYAKDPTSDIHRDTCMGLFFIDEFGTDKVHKKLRQIAKNSYVFPELYGSYWGSCSKSLWEDIAFLSFEDGTTVRQHLANNGVVCFSNRKGKKEDPKPGSYEYHTKEFERKFWKRFSTAKEWQEEQIKFYLKHGYIENFFGFRRRGYLSKNQVINTNIQGASFHCLLWSMVETKKLEKKEKWKSKIRGQVHDEIKYSAHKDEYKHVMKTLQYIMTEKIREVYDWIIVPLKAEHSIGPLGGSWLDVKELSDEEFKEFVK